MREKFIEEAKRYIWKIQEENVKKSNRKRNEQKSYEIGEIVAIQKKKKSSEPVKTAGKTYRSLSSYQVKSNNRYDAT